MVTDRDLTTSERMALLNPEELTNFKIVQAAYAPRRGPLCSGEGARCQARATATEAAIAAYRASGLTCRNGGAELMDRKNEDE